MLDIGRFLGLNNRIVKLFEAKIKNHQTLIYLQLGYKVKIKQLIVLKKTVNNLPRRNDFALYLSKETHFILLNTICNLSWPLSSHLIYQF